MAWLAGLSLIIMSSLDSSIMHANSFLVRCQWREQLGRRL